MSTLPAPSWSTPQTVGRFNRRETTSLIKAWVVLNSANRACKADKEPQPAYFRVPEKEEQYSQVNNGTLGPLCPGQDIKMNSFFSYPQNTPGLQLYQKAKQQIIRNVTVKHASSCVTRRRCGISLEIASKQTISHIRSPLQCGLDAETD